MARSRILCLRTIEKDSDDRVVVQVGRSGEATLDLNLVGSEGEHPYKASRKNIIIVDSPMIQYHVAHLLRKSNRPICQSHALETTRVTTMNGSLCFVGCFSERNRPHSSLSSFMLSSS